LSIICAKEMLIYTILELFMIILPLSIRFGKYTFPLTIPNVMVLYGTRIGCGKDRTRDGCLDEGRLPARRSRRTFQRRIEK
jgi:hypothetical protein